MKLHLGACTHSRTGLAGAKLLKSAIKDVDRVVEIHNIDGKPLVDIFSWRDPYSLHEISTPQCCIDVAFERCPLCDESTGSFAPKT